MFVDSYGVVCFFDFVVSSVMLLIVHHISFKLHHFNTCVVFGGVDMLRIRSNNTTCIGVHKFL